ncbi:MAG: hypothetical protein R3D80_17405 [Paracoccaceae bacterium]
MPVVVSIVVVSLLWRFIYDGNDGLLNNILGALTSARVCRSTGSATRRRRWGRSS